MFKSAVLAAVAVVGIGSAAGAATVKSVETYHLNLRYEGTVFGGVYWDSSDDDFGYIDYTTLENTPVWMKSFLYRNLNVDDVIIFSATVLSYEDDPNRIDNRATSTECTLGSQQCHITQARDLSGQKWLSSEDVDDYHFNVEVGSSFIHSRWAVRDWYPGEFHDGAYYRFHAEFETSYFTVIPEVSPVPLPASAALLPLGIGALALLRKRRRKVSGSSKQACRQSQPLLAAGSRRC